MSEDTKISSNLIRLRKHLIEKRDVEGLVMIEKIKTSYCKIGEGLIKHLRTSCEIYRRNNDYLTLVPLAESLIGTIQSIDQELQEGWK